MHENQNALKDLMTSGREDFLREQLDGADRKENSPVENEFSSAPSPTAPDSRGGKLMFCRRNIAFRVQRLLRWVKRWLLAILSINKFRSEITYCKHARLLKKSGYFDKDFYVRSYPDVINSGLNPIRHYLLYGGLEGRNPSDLFDSSSYLIYNPGVAQSGVNPLVHFLLHGNGKNETGEIDYKKFSEGYLSRLDNPQFWPYGENVSSGSLVDAEIQMIKKSGYFDADYYLRVNADVKASGIAPEFHFYHFGWKEGRNPGPLFETFYYLSTYADVKDMGVNPLIHYIKFGEAEGRLPKPFEYDESQCIAEADITDADMIEPIEKPIKIAVVCHLFHKELADEFMMYFRRIPYPCDFYITTSEQSLSYLEEYFGQKMKDVNINIRAVPNLGRDVAPFLSMFSDCLRNYDLVCKVHSKKSSHNKELEGWRTYLLENLLGSRKIIKRIITAFEADERLGIVWPLPFPYLKYLGIHLGWGPALSREKNRQNAMLYFSDLQPPALDEPFHFPVGNMFWFRPLALSYFNTLKFSQKDFEVESGDIDGALSHTIERMMGKMAEMAGYKHKTVFFPREVVHSERESGIDFRAGSRKILFIAHDLFRAGAEMILLHILNWLKRHTAYELTVVAIKKGNDGGKMLTEYRRAAKVILLDEMLAHHREQEAFDMIKGLTGNVDLIYGNTILSATVYRWLVGFGAPVITHIHELEESIKIYATPEIRNQMKKTTATYIACSLPVYNNLMVNHGLEPAILHQVDEFIRPGFFEPADKIHHRQMYGLPTDKAIIWGCGTIYWRKGTDLFIETAGILKNMGIVDFVFCWIGSNHWNNEMADWGEWQMQEKRISELQLEDIVLFTGEKENPKEYFKAGDMFYLPSREDPYPLVCLEAAECELPVICFADAGGMPAFVEEDAGYIVPYLDIMKAAEAIGQLISDKETRIKKGKAARNKMLARHTDDIAVPQILKICHAAMKTAPAVSVIVPVFNQAPFLRNRLDSILKQQFRDVEIIILDDASTDNSLEVASEYLSHPALRIIGNETNSGSPLRQWQKGIEMARGALVWIAEGDDYASHDFLSSLIPAFNNLAVMMAYCASHCVDENDVVSNEHYLRSGHYDGLGFPRERWQNDYITDGRQEIENALAVRNIIPNVSAVLFRRSVFDHLDFSGISGLKTTGDWKLYLSVLKKGSLAYFHQHLNFHRIHAKSVIGATKNEAALTVPEYYHMHRFIHDEFEIPKNIRKLMVESVELNLRNLWPEMTDDKFEQYYDVRTFDLPEKALS